MDRKLSVAVLAAALLVSGLLVGVSQGSGERASKGIGSRGIAFEVVGGDDLADAEKGLVNQLRQPALDASGDRVGTIRWTCINGSDYYCTIAYRFRESATTDSGSIVVAGTFAGFNGERMPITGGTDDYLNAGGAVTLSVEGGNFTHTFDLVA